MKFASQLSIMGLFASPARRKALVSASSLALLAATGAAALAQNDNAPQPPAAAAPQPPVPTPASATPPADQAPQQTATPAPQPMPAPATSQQATGGHVLPETRVVAPVERRRPRTPPRTRVVANPPQPAPAQAQVLTEQNQRFDAARQTILAPSGTAPYQMTQEAIESLPQGENTSLDRVLLQAPGATQDSAASGNLHVRNEHANVQYRINGIMLPDGVGAFGQILDTGIVGKLALITGALPAQYGLRTAGVVDIQTKASAFDNTGKVSVYGGSHDTITPSAEWGGTVGSTQYFVSGRYFGSDLGLENPTSSSNAIHDHTDQGKGFAYVSTVIDPTLRLTYMGAAAYSHFQIPDRPAATIFAVWRDQFQLRQSQRDAERVQPVQRAGAAIFQYRAGPAGLVFQPPQHGAFYARRDRRSCLQRGCLRRVPPQSYQRDPDRCLLSADGRPHAARGV